MIRRLSLLTAFALTLVAATKPSTSVIAMPECGNHCPFVIAMPECGNHCPFVIAMPECGNHCPFIK